MFSIHSIVIGGQPVSMEVSNTDTLEDNSYAWRSQLPIHWRTTSKNGGSQYWYRMAGNFRGRKLLWIGEKNMTFAEKTYADCSLLPHQRMPSPQISRRKLSWIATHSQKFSHNCEICESFLPQTFPAIQYIGGQLLSIEVPNTDTLMSWYEWHECPECSIVQWLFEGPDKEWLRMT